MKNTMDVSCWPRRRVSFAPPARNSGAVEDRSRGEDGSGASVEDRSGGPKRDVSPAPSGESGWSQAPGDSVASAPMPEEEDPADSNSAPPAVAESRKPRDTAPPAVAEGKWTPLRSSVLNDRADVGNIGFFFGNWGQRTKQKGGRVQDNIDAQIKKTQHKSLVSLNAKRKHRLCWNRPQLRAIRTTRGEVFRSSAKPRIHYFARKRRSERSCGSAFRSCG